uniref:Atherin-like n=1 Tax=Phascolarctos cinereus TaxID=38626 RepID=A0A6P5LT14_PHACI|nr:atherin-like [Phascolarctos cinereus]
MTRKGVGLLTCPPPAVSLIHDAASAGPRRPGASGALDERPATDPHPPPTVPRSPTRAEQTPALGAAAAPMPSFGDRLQSTTGAGGGSKFPAPSPRHTALRAARERSSARKLRPREGKGLVSRSLWHMLASQATFEPTTPEAVPYIAPPCLSQSREALLQPDPKPLPPSEAGSSPASVPGAPW